MPDWSEVFDPRTPLLEIFLRGTIVYLVLFAMLRLVASRTSGGLGVTDLLVLVLVADAAQNAMADNYRSVPDGLLLVGTIIGWSLALEWLGYHSPWLQRRLKPRAEPLIEDGRLNHKVMRRELLTMDELMTQLRLHGVADPGEVARAYIEPSGLVSVIRRDRGEPEQPHMRAGIR